MMNPRGLAREGSQGETHQNDHTKTNLASMYEWHIDVTSHELEITV
jgi:hypothetical protein